MQHRAIHGPWPRARVHIAVAAVSFGDYALPGDAADIIAGQQRTRQRW